MDAGFYFKQLEIMPYSSTSNSEDNDFAAMLEAYIEVAPPEQGELLKARGASTSI